MSRPRYHIWCVRPSGKPDVLMAVLGFKRHLVGRWERYARCPPVSRSLEMTQLLALHSTDPFWVKFCVYGAYRTRPEAEAVLLNLRAQNKLILVHDCVDKRGTRDRLGRTEST